VSFAIKPAKSDLTKPGDRLRHRKHRRTAQKNTKSGLADAQIAKVFWARQILKTQETDIVSGTFWSETASF